MKDHDDIKPNPVFTDAPDAEPHQHKPRVLHVDVERFQHHLDETDLSEAEKAQYLHIIWSIIMEFIDLGYGVHPVQQICGQVTEGACDGDHAGASLLSSEAQPKTNMAGTNPAESEE